MSNTGTIRLCHLVAFLLLASCPLTVISQDEEPRLTLPFRIDRDEPLPLTSPLSAATLQLTVNGRATSVEDLVCTEQTLWQKRGRNQIVLAVINGRYNPVFEELIVRLYQEAWTAGDRLTLCTPLRTLPTITLTEPLTATLKETLQILADDMDTFTGLLKNTEARLNALKAQLPAKPSHRNWDSVFAQYENESLRLEQHRNAALFVHLSEAINRLDSPLAPTWLILFDDGPPPFERIGWPILNSVTVRGLSPDQKLNYDRLDSRLTQTDMTPLRDVANDLLLRKVGMITFTFPPSPANAFSSWGSKLAHLTSTAHHPFESSQRAFDAVSSLKDTLYEVLYRHDGTIEDKTYRLSAPQLQQPLFYPSLIRANAFAHHKGSMTQPTVAISSLTLSDGVIRCEIEGIQNGPIRVAIRIANETGQVCFDQSKEMQTRDSKVVISLPLSSEIKGYLAVTVTVTDLKTETSQQKRIYGKK